MFSSLHRLARRSHGGSAARSSTRAQVAPRLELLEGRELMAAGLSQLHVSRLMGANFREFRALMRYDQLHGPIKTTGGSATTRDPRMVPDSMAVSFAPRFAPAVPSDSRRIPITSPVGPLTPQSPVNYGVAVTATTTASPTGTAENPTAGQIYASPVTPQSTVLYGSSITLSTSSSGEVMVNRGIESYPSGPVTPSTQITF